MAFEYASFAVRNPTYVAQNARQQWAVRKSILEFRRDNPICAATGKTWKLHVHHKIPVSVRPDLAGDKSNMVVLEKGAHFQIGHGGRWTTYEEDIDFVLGSRRIVQTVAA